MHSKERGKMSIFPAEVWNVIVECGDVATLKTMEVAYPAQLMYQWPSHLKLKLFFKEVFPILYEQGLLEFEDAKTLRLVISAWKQQIDEYFTVTNFDSMSYRGSGSNFAAVEIWLPLAKDDSARLIDLCKFALDTAKGIKSPFKKGLGFPNKLVLKFPMVLDGEKYELGEFSELVTNLKPLWSCFDHLEILHHGKYVRITNRDLARAGRMTTWGSDMDSGWFIPIVQNTTNLVSVRASCSLPSVVNAINAHLPNPEQLKWVMLADRFVCPCDLDWGPSSLIKKCAPKLEMLKIDCWPQIGHTFEEEKFLELKELQVSVCSFVSPVMLGFGLKTAPNLRKLSVALKDNAAMNALLLLTKQRPMLCHVWFSASWTINVETIQGCASEAVKTLEITDSVVNVKLVSRFPGTNYLRVHGSSATMISDDEKNMGLVSDAKICVWTMLPHLKRITYIWYTWEEGETLAQKYEAIKL